MTVRIELELLENRALFSAAPITFGAIAGYHSGDRARHLVAGDFNHDGYNDLAVVNTDVDANSISILLNNGNGTFAAPVIYHLTFSADKDKLGPDNIACADFNGDGILDLAIVTRNPDTNSTNLVNDPRVHDGLTILFGNGNGAFDDQTDYRILHGTRAISIGDFNGDGHPDIVVGAVQNMGVILNNGDGTFSSQTLYPAGYGHSQSFEVGDFNGDGLPDIVDTKGNDKSVRVFLNRGGGVFGVGVRTPVNGVALDAAIGDFNGDGKLDLAVDNSQFRQGISVLLGNGDGTFTQQPTLRGGSFFQSIVAADFNGDGNIDLASLDFISSVKTFQGNGDGTFAAPVLQPGGNLNFDLIAVDLNNDGKLDLAWTRRDKVNVLLNTSP